ncbi:hypothetical protein J2Y63_006382, partial [Shinella sp. BE166]|uniref:YcxB family protein n=1 Tax=Shinella sp. BE166 TaxID=3373918 RepID=UPI003EB8EFB9
TLKIFAEIRFAHDALPASKLGKKASTNLGAIQSSFWLWLPTCLLVVALLSLATHWLAWGASFLYYGQIASADATITISLSDEAVRVRSSVADSIVPWATVKRIIREEHYLMLPISKREAFILPRRSFKTQNSFEDAFRYAREKI